MKAASARPRASGEVEALGPDLGPAEGSATETAVHKKREARIVARREDTVDETEQLRRRLLAQYMQSEGRSAITRAADKYFQAGFEIPVEQEAQLKLLEHFDESRVSAGLEVLTALIQSEAPRQLPLFRQRLRRLEDYAEDPGIRQAAADLRRILPG
jgi:hypothetical protein